ncbi:MAG: ClpXP protease specificity-enhancing factor [Spongiibacteraceae bacterium]
MSMTSSRPYLARAIYEWILDNRLTPYALVDATLPGVQVPTSFVKDGRIVLNIAPSATSGLLISDRELMCSARFGGVPMELHVPMSALLGVYARENGRGMMFEAEPDSNPAPDPAPGDGAGKSARPTLKVVK